MPTHTNPLPQQPATQARRRARRKHLGDRHLPKQRARVAHTLAGVARLLDSLRLYGAAELIRSTIPARIPRSPACPADAPLQSLPLPHPALGGRLRRGAAHGLAAATGAIVCTIDGAATYEPAEMLKLVDIMHLTARRGHRLAVPSLVRLPAPAAQQGGQRLYRLLAPGDLFVTPVSSALRRDRLARVPRSPTATSAHRAAHRTGPRGRHERDIRDARQARYGDTPRQTLEIVRDHLRLIARIFFAAAGSSRRRRRRPFHGSR